MSFSAILFLASLAFVVYTLFGYPLLLAFLSRRNSRPVVRKPQWKSVSVLLPVRNGERWIARKLDSILALEYPRELLEILVVSDGSTDATATIAAGYASKGVRLISIPPLGKAAALNAAIEASRGDILFFTDVRQQFEPAALRILVSCLADPCVGVVSGELVIRDGNMEETAVGLYWRYEKYIRQRLSALDSVMGATGCIYAMRRELAEPLPARTLADDMYLPLGAFLRGYRVVFSEAKAFDEATGLRAEFRRKVRTLAGVYQILALRPALLGRRNRMWVHFVSHKLARLLLPYALIGLALSAAWLPHPWAAFALAPQAGFYAVAALDARVPERWAVKRLSAPVRTFAVLMAATLCAGAILFVPSDRFWRSPTAGSPVRRAAATGSGDA